MIRRSWLGGDEGRPASPPLSAPLTLVEKRLRNRLQREYDDCQDASDQESFMSGYARKTQPQLAEDRTLELWVCANIDVRASKRLAPKRRRFDAVSDETIGGCIASNHSHV